MACKCIRKLILVVIEFLILILLKVQANNHGHISFTPFSSPIQLPHFSKLNTVQTNNLAPPSICPAPMPIMYPHSFDDLDKVHRQMHKCVVNTIRACEKTWPEKGFKFKFCLRASFRNCRIVLGVDKSMVTWLWACLMQCVRRKINEVESCYLSCARHP
jgi:hypothetical protein